VSELLSWSSPYSLSLRSLADLKTFSEGAIVTISRAVNVDDIRKQLDRIERKLNSAIQQLQASHSF
jgi:hypothetical protein